MPERGSLVREDRSVVAIEMRKVVAIENVSTWRTNEEVLSLLSSIKVLIVSICNALIFEMILVMVFKFCQIWPDLARLSINKISVTSRAVVSRVRYEEDNGHKRIHWHEQQ
jgi:hypothetical protein